VRFSIARQDPRIHTLVVGFHREGAPAAATWREVGAAAQELGLARPSYHTIRELVRAEELRRRARRDSRRAALDVLTAAASSRVVDLPIALDALELTRAKGKLVSDRHKPS
jgi:hypothetical protein